MERVERVERVERDIGEREREVRAGGDGVPTSESWRKVGVRSSRMSLSHRSRSRAEGTNELVKSQLRI